MDMQDQPMLLVDNNPADIELTTMAFRRNGVGNQIQVARDGAEALDLLLPADGSQPPLLSVVLMDISMPRMSGLEALRALRADPRTQQLPVIMLSSSIEDRDVLASHNLGANGFVQKPVDYLQFLEVAHELGVHWLDLQH